MAADMKIKGFDELERAMKEIGGKPTFKASASATGFSMTKVLKMAKSLVPQAPDDGGTLKESLGKKTIRNKARAIVTTLVGIKSGMTSSRKHGRRNPQQYAHLVELGNRSIPPRSFIRHAWLSLQDDSFKRYRTKFWKELQKEVKKFRKGPG